MKEKDILLVDDQEKWRDQILDIIKDKNYSVVTASNYDEALEALTTTQFKLAIIDIRLVDSDDKNEDGLRLLFEIDKAVLDTKVVILTGFELEPQQVNQQKERASQSPRLLDFIKKRELDVPNFRDLVSDALS